MTGWMLSLVGIIFASVISEIIMPEGKTSSFIRSILVIIFMYVVLTPVINWVNSDEIININSVIESYKIMF